MNSALRVGFLSAQGVLLSQQTITSSERTSLFFFCFKFSLSFPLSSRWCAVLCLLLRTYQNTKISAYVRVHSPSGLCSCSPNCFPGWRVELLAPNCSDRLFRSILLPNCSDLRGWTALCAKRLVHFTRTTHECGVLLLIVYFW